MTDSIAFVGHGDPSATITDHLWTSNLDGSLSTSASFSTTLTEGTHTITYRVTNLSGFDEASDTVVVNASVPQPTAVIEDISPSPATSGENVTFLGRGDPLATITSYEWRSDQIVQPLSTERNFSTSLLAAGTHTITLRVENATGSDETQATLVVEAAVESPVAFIDSITPSPALDSEIVEFSGRGEPSVEIITFVWTSDLVEGDLSGQANFSVNLPSGMHTIMLRVENAGGLFDTTTMALEVMATGPEVTISSIGPDPVTEGETVEFTGSATPANDIAAYRWRSDQVVEDLSSQSSFAIDTLPAGTHTITFSAQNQAGVWSSPEAEGSLLVEERPVATIGLVSPSPATLGDPVSFNGSATPAGDIEEYRWRTSAGDELSDQASFSSDVLPIGTHTILFSARNDLGVWSNEDSRTLQIDPVEGEDIFVDNGATTTESVGLWAVSSGSDSFRRKSFFSNDVGATYTYRPSVEQSGLYELFLRWTAFGNRRSDVPVLVESDDGDVNVSVNQQQNAGEWVSIGTYRFTDKGGVTLRSLGVGQSTCVDGLRMVRVGN
jgi:hypothetical protein